jgi:hypothetical protein
MGLFDSIYLPLKCPNCGDEGDKELQTKDLWCDLDVYRVGDSIGTIQYRWLDCHAGCRSEACRAWEKEKWQGRSVGFGFGWEVWAEIDDVGRITGRVVTELPPALPRKEQAHG